MKRIILDDRELFRAVDKIKRVLEEADRKRRLEKKRKLRKISKQK